MIHLVTIVPVDIQKSSGLKFLHDFKKQVERCMVHVKAHVEVNWQKGSGMFFIYQVLIDHLWI